MFQYLLHRYDKSINKYGKCYKFGTIKTKNANGRF